MNPIEEGKKGLTRSAQMMLNLSVGIIRSSSKTSPGLLEEQLKDVFSSVSYADGNGNALERSESMKSKFSNTLNLMRKNEVDLTRESLIHVFKNSLDSQANEVLQESLSEENKLFIENAQINESERTQAKKDFGSGGLSM